MSARDRRRRTAAARRVARRTPWARRRCHLPSPRRNAIIGIGVISLIAANWDNISDTWKILGDFVLMTVLAGWTYRSRITGKQTQFEILLLSFLIWCLASIGLIAQVFHTGGQLYEALMLWSAITFAAVFTSQQFFVPFVWTAGFLSGAVFSALESVYLQSIFHQNYQAVFMAVPLLCACLMTLSKLSGDELAATRAFRYFVVLGSLLALAVAEVHDFSWKNIHASVIPYIPGYCLAACSAIGIWRNQDYRRIQKILLVMILTIFMLPFHLPLLQIKSSLLYATFTIIILSLFSIFLASLRERRLFQWFLIILGLRFLILYFQALGGLATTGVGLIISGGLLIGMAILWNKYKTALAMWAEGWAQ